MNNITTTTIRDTIIETGNSYIEEFDVNFTQSSETVNSENYYVGDFEKYPYFIVKNLTFKNVFRHPFIKE